MGLSVSHCLLASPVEPIALGSLTVLDLGDPLVESRHQTGKALKQSGIDRLGIDLHVAGAVARVVPTAEVLAGASPVLPPVGTRDGEHRRAAGSATSQSGRQVSVCRPTLHVLLGGRTITLGPTLLDAVEGLGVHDRLDPLGLDGLPVNPITHSVKSTVFFGLLPALVPRWAAGVSLSQAG